MSLDHSHQGLVELQLGGQGLHHVPLMYLGVQFIFVLEAVYPRHILVAHLAMGVVSMFAASRYSVQSLGIPKLSRKVASHVGVTV